MKLLIDKGSSFRILGVQGVTLAIGGHQIGIDSVTIPYDEVTIFQSRNRVLRVFLFKKNQVLSTSNVLENRVKVL